MTDVIVRYNPQSLSIILNRPEAINSLTVEMIDAISDALIQARNNDSIHFVVIYGNGSKGFCAGGDIKKLYQACVQGDSNFIQEFYSKEYDLDFTIHTFPKSIIVIADGITMGGGLGLAAGAQFVIVTEKTVMAMPETRIGFFPDVGATGWLYTKCRKGYPKYLALTGDNLHGDECVHVGLAHHHILSHILPQCVDELENLRGSNKDIQLAIERTVLKYATTVQHDRNIKDEWVARFFDTEKPLQSILQSLAQCSTEHELCSGVFTRIAERSPTSLVMTDLLLKANKGKALDEVFARELQAAIFMTHHHDYREGVRARLIDKDNIPQWKPATIEEVDVGLLSQVIGTA
ncbi:MAG: enoyl-CoA hydratase/isomerase family protein [Spirochaetota bacterium]